jgi:hypothetical protein
MDDKLQNPRQTWGTGAHLVVFQYGGAHSDGTVMAVNSDLFPPDGADGGKSD